MAPQTFHDFFLGSTSIAGALVGLLFVAVSVATPQLAAAGGRSQVHRIRADAALTAFSNALVVSLFALIPGVSLGWVCVSVAATGLLFVLASLVSLARVRVKRWSLARDAVFLVGMVSGFAVELASGLELASSPENRGEVQNIAILVVVFFLLGISRAWELVGGPSIGLRHELTALVRGREIEPAPGETPLTDKTRETKPGNDKAVEGVGVPEPGREPESD